MEFWIRRASSSGYIWEGEDIEMAENLARVHTQKK